MQSLFILALFVKAFAAPPEPSFEEDSVSTTSTITTTLTTSMAGLISDQLSATKFPVPGLFIVPEANINPNEEAQVQNPGDSFVAVDETNPSKTDTFTFSQHQKCCQKKQTPSSSPNELAVENTATSSTETHTIRNGSAIVTTTVNTNPSTGGGARAELAVAAMALVAAYLI